MRLALVVATAGAFGVIVATSHGSTPAADSTLTSITTETDCSVLQTAFDDNYRLGQRVNSDAAFRRMRELKCMNRPVPSGTQQP